MCVEHLLPPSSSFPSLQRLFARADNMLHATTMLTTHRREGTEVGQMRGKKREIGGAFGSA
jgi:hypothetical protein